MELSCLIWELIYSWWRHQNIFRVTGPLCVRGATSHRWIPLTKASDAELWCFLWSAPEWWSKQLRRRWFETPSRSLWRRCDIFFFINLITGCFWSICLIEFWSLGIIIRYHRWHIQMRFRVSHRYKFACHNHDVIMSTMASQITSLTIVYSIVYSGVDQRKHQSSVSLAFVTGEFPAQMASNAEMFPFYDVIMQPRISMSDTKNNWDSVRSKVFFEIII